MNQDVRISEKAYLTLQEAAEYTNVGVNRLRKISDEPGCPFVLWVGSKRLLNRRLLEAYLETAYSI